MKSVLITSLVSIAIGFTGGWLIRSASSDLNTVTRVTPPPIERRPPTAPPQIEVPEERNSPGIPNPRPEKLGKVMTADDIEIPESSIQADKAKWTRLGEVLGLSTDQSKAIAAILAEIKLAPVEGESPDIAYQRMGEQLEKSILATLDPAQQEAFRKFQQRALENKVEVLAQKSLAEEVGNLDLTAAQREQVLSMIRSETQADVATISPATRLTLSGSILPIGNEKFSDEGILLLRKLNSEGNQASMETLSTINRAEIEKQWNRYEGILTPGQLESYRASLGESLENIKILSPPK